MADLDLTRLAYVAASKRDELRMTVTEIANVTGCSRRQVSHFFNGKPVNAAATFLLVELLDIDLLEMLPPDLQSLVLRIRRLHEAERKQCVTPPVSCEAGSIPIVMEAAE